MKQLFYSFYATDLNVTSSRIFILDSETILIVDNVVEEKIKETILKYKENPKRKMIEYDIDTFVIKDKNLVDKLSNLEFGVLYDTNDFPNWEIEEGQIIKLKDYQL